MEGELSNEELKKELVDALTALAEMWNQYCPPPLTHMFMSAGEHTEDVLDRWGMLKEDESAVYLDWDAPIPGSKVEMLLPKKV